MTVAPRAGLHVAHRVIGELWHLPHGPTLICIGGLHGNEPSGVLALQRVLDRLEQDGIVLDGNLIALSGNRPALNSRQRYVDEDLNRIWTSDRLNRLRSGANPESLEEGELLELDQHLRRVLRRARRRPHVLDLHSTSAPGPPFVTLDDGLINRRFAEAFPVPHVLGLEEELSGTMLENLTDRGLIGVGFEAGQHDGPESVEVAEAAIWIALERTGVLQVGRRPEPEQSRRRLRELGATLPSAVEVRYRHALEQREQFQMAPGLRSFQQVRSGQTLGRTPLGPVLANMNGLLLMPLYQPWGHEGFFVVRPVRAFWLKLSAMLRRRWILNMLLRLPGVRPHEELSGVYVVDRRKAPVMTVPVFHLFGMKRIGRLRPFYYFARRQDTERELSRLA